MSTRVPVNPDLLHWALERAGISADALAKKFPKLNNWLGGELAPTLKQLEAFANTTHTAIGLLFLPQPPEEPLPIPDFRTLPEARLSRPSADLLDIIYLCQQRQALVSGLPTPSWRGGGYFFSFRLGGGQGAWGSSQDRPNHWFRSCRAAAVIDLVRRSAPLHLSSRTGRDIGYGERRGGQ